MARGLPVVGIMVGLAVMAAPAAIAQIDPFAKEQAAKAEEARREESARDDAIRRELAARLVAAREEAAARAFAPDFRRAMADSLAARPLGELQAMADGHAPIAPLNLGDAAADLVYTPVNPCRVLDTRFAGGPFGGGAQRHIRVAGPLSGQGGAADCTVPSGPATSVVLNFVAVAAAGSGNLRAFAAGSAVPIASVLNYAQVPGLNIANGVVVPLCDSSATACTNDLTIQADFGTTQVVVDVLGYFRKTRKEQVRTFTVTDQSGSTVAVGTTCTHHAGATVTITAPVAGTVIVRANAWFRYSHVNGSSENVLAHIGQTATDCGGDLGFSTQHATPSAYPSTGAATGHITLPVMREFAVGPGTYTYYLNAVASTFSSYEFWYSGLAATFHPN